jgi:hypothetical protein
MLSAAVLAALALDGCGFDGGNALPGYLTDRGKDIADCFTVHAGFGTGLDVQAHATDWLALGAGAAHNWQFGWEGRRYAEREDAHVGLPILPFAAWRDAVRGTRRPQDTLPVFLSLFLVDRSDGAITYVSEDPEPEPPPAWARRVRSLLGLDAAALRLSSASETLLAGHEPRPLIDRFGVQLTTTLGVPTLRLGLSGGQLLDFLLGWTTLDIAGDDALTARRRSLRSERSP